MHSEFGEFALEIRRANSYGVPAPRRRGAAAPPTANVFGTLRAKAAGRCTLFAIIRTANSHGEATLTIPAARGSSMLILN